MTSGDTHSNLTAAEQPFTFQDMLGPVGVETFKQTNWPYEPYWNTRSDELSEALTGIPGLASNREFLGWYQGTVSALKRDGTAINISGGPEAVDAYEHGFTCYLRSVEQYVPEIDAVRREIADVLAIPEQFMTTELFCSERDSGVAMHSDYDVNFAMLVRGEKHWRLAPNETLENQPGICIAGNKQPHPDVRKLTRGVDVPAAMPEDHVKLTMGPGGVLFLPRGWWHDTHAVGECLQINFVMKGPQYADLAVAALRGVLLADASWRQFAYGLADETNRQANITEVTQLVHRLRDILMQVDDAQIARHIIETALAKD